MPGSRLSKNHSNPFSMIRHEISFPVRYYECDPMGIVHHSNYVRFFEVARDEMISSWGYGMEKCAADGLVFPVVNISIKFRHSLFVGDTARVTAEIGDLPLAKLTVHQCVYNQNGDLCAEGTVVLGFMNSQTGRIMGCPEKFMEVLKAHVL